MTHVMGRPGTRSGLALRVSQFVCATAALVTISSAFAFTNYSAFFILACSMFLQLCWSFAMACIDIICLATNTDLRRLRYVSAILIGDWCTGILSFSAATAAAGVFILFKRDTEFCREFPQHTCDKYQLSVILAFMEWSFTAASSLSLFWFWASLW